MKNPNIETSSGVFANQDMMELLQHCRNLHDRAVFEFFLGLAAKCQKRFHKITSVSTNESKGMYREDREVFFRR